MIRTLRVLPGSTRLYNKIFTELAGKLEARVRCAHEYLKGTSISEHRKRSVSKCSPLQLHVATVLQTFWGVFLVHGGVIGNET